jgi:raffinose/stachyose/melibiose transport system permease protein
MAGVAPARAGRTRTRSASRGFSHAGIYAVAAVLAVLVLVPLVYVVLGGFRTTGQLAAKPVGIPQPWVTSNYRELISSGTFWRQIGNSALIAAIATTLVVAFGALAAYALSRFEFRGRESLYTLFTFGLLFPISVAILPLYLLIRQLGLLDTALGVAVPEAAFGLPLTILILRPFMRSVPVELEDAAAIDGCGRLGFFWRILVPLSQPALATVAIVAVVFSWNMFLLPLLVLNNTKEWTLPLGVAAYSTEYTQDTARILAYTALSMVPALAFFVAAERRIVGGLSGAVKG